MKSHLHWDSNPRLQPIVSSYTHFAVPAHKTLKIRHTQHISYARSNNPQVDSAVHTLNNHHEYDPVDEILGMAKPFTEMS
jgi:hypothetical protein